MIPIRTNRDNLESFLYILMRDHLPSGTVEEIMEKHVENLPVTFDGGTIQYTNPYLFEHARDVANRLKVKND